MTDKPKCKAHKKDGTPCGRWPVKGATVCPKHGGSAPQVRRKAQERLLEAADSLMAQLLKIASSAESEAVRLAATRDALDRAGFAPAQLVKLGIGNEDPWGDMLAEIMSDDVLERVDPKALTVRRGGGLIERHQDVEDGSPPELVVDVSDDLGPDDLSLDIPGTIRGEVVHYPGPTPEQAAGIRRNERRIPGMLLGGEAAERALAAEKSEYSTPESRPMDDPAAPPAYVREAMEAEGQSWQPQPRNGVRWTR